MACGCGLWFVVVVCGLWFVVVVCGLCFVLCGLRIADCGDLRIEVAIWVFRV